MTSGTEHVLVAGAGIVGICCAIELIERGFRVTLCDPEPPGSQTSYGNAAAFAATEVVPLGSPDTWRRAPGWLLDPRGPLAIRWRHLPAFAPWLWRFVRCGRRGEVERISRALSGLLAPSIAATRALLGRAGLERMFTANGALTVYRGETGPARHALEWEIKRARGVECRFLDGKAVRDMEPALRNVACGVFAPQCCGATNPYKLAAALADYFQSLGGGVRRATVRDFLHADERPRAAVVDGETVAFDRLVICAGVWSKRLCEMLGDAVLLESERGYNTTLPNPGVELKRLVFFGDHGFVATPLDEGLRIGGAVEFAGLKAPPNYERSARLIEIAQRYLPALDARGGKQWMGHRPSTPDSLPVIGRATAFENVLYAFGHGHLGLTLAAITARLIGELARDGAASIDLGPFDVARFNGSGAARGV